MNVINVNTQEQAAELIEQIASKEARRCPTRYEAYARNFSFCVRDMIAAASVDARPLLYAAGTSHPDYYPA